MKVKALVWGCIVAVSILITGCGRTSDSSAGSHSHGHGHGHHHEPPHGGTPVILGNEEFHLEFVLDKNTGKMQAYVLDAHMEGFVRLPIESFTVAAKIGDKNESLIFKAVTNTATGEKAGDTALFETQADWLKSTSEFEATLNQIDIRGKTYQNVRFNFPAGNQAPHKH